MTEILPQKLIDIQTQNHAQPLCSCLSNDNSELLIGLNDGTYQILQLPHYTLIAYFTLRQQGYPIHLEYSACGDHFLSLNYVGNNHVLIKIENQIIPRLQGLPQLVPALISTFVQYEIPIKCVANRIIISQLIYDIKKLAGFSLLILAQNKLSEFRIDLSATQISNETIHLTQLDQSDVINDVTLLFNKFLIVHIKQKLLIYQRDYFRKGKYILACTFNPLGNVAVEKQLNKTLFVQHHSKCILQLKFGFDLIPFQSFEALEQYKLQRLRIEAIVQDFKIMQQQVHQLTMNLKLDFTDTFAVQLNSSIIYVCKLLVSDLPALIKQETDYDLPNQLCKTYQININTDNYHKILSEDQVGMIGYYQNSDISVEVFQKSYSVVYGSKNIVKTYPIMPDCSILSCIFQNVLQNKDKKDIIVKDKVVDLFNGEAADFCTQLDSLTCIMLIQQIQAFATCQSVITNKLLMLDFQQYQEYSGYFPGFQQYDKPTIYYEREDEFDRIPDDHFYDEIYYQKGGEKRSKEKCIDQIDGLKGYLV